jgi:hypothetical protein
MSPGPLPPHQFPTSARDAGGEGGTLTSSSPSKPERKRTHAALRFRSQFNPLTAGRALSERAQRRALRANPLVPRKALQGKVPQGRHAPCASLHGA